MSAEGSQDWQPDHLESCSPPPPPAPKRPPQKSGSGPLKAHGADLGGQHIFSASVKICLIFRLSDKKLSPPRPPVSGPDHSLEVSSG